MFSWISSAHLLPATSCSLGWDASCFSPGDHAWLVLAWGLKSGFLSFSWLLLFCFGFRIPHGAGLAALPLCLWALCLMCAYVHAHVPSCCLFGPSTEESCVFVHSASLSDPILGQEGFQVAAALWGYFSPLSWFAAKLDAPEMALWVFRNLILEKVNSTWSVYSSFPCWFHAPNIWALLSLVKALKCLRVCQVRV